MRPFTEAFWKVPNHAFIRPFSSSPLPHTHTHTHTHKLDCTKRGGRREEKRKREFSGA